MCKQPCTIKHGAVRAPPTQLGKAEPALKRDQENQLVQTEALYQDTLYKKNEMSLTPSSTIQPSDWSDSGFTLIRALLFFDWLAKTLDLHQLIRPHDDLVSPLS